MKNRKGQVALFVALIFQILFLFFAMVINVGLLVHHKINLQNSVDLAAYYGAMKQAENMNAIAHINYQIRQSWKLLAWRYRVLGTAGDFSEHPLEKANRSLTVRAGSAATDDISPLVNSDASVKKFYDAPSFCISYMPVKPTPPGENTCRDLKNMSGVNLFNAPVIAAPFQNFSQIFATATEVYKKQALQGCRLMGAMNYDTLARFVVGFNMDQADRMSLIAAISRTMSASTENFMDLDGESVKDGIEKTLKNNLTSANLDGLVAPSLKIFNSLAQDGCNNTTADTLPAKWLVPIRIFPAFNYIDSECISGNNAAINPKGKELGSAQSDWPLSVATDITHPMYQNIKLMSQFLGMRSDPNDIHNFSLGVEKNPWCMAYVGVSAETKPSIPFSPFGPVTLKARAFFKPFGGRIGPWYGKVWERNAGKSTGEKVDTNLPDRIEAGQTTLGNVQDPTRSANYSRYVGDEFGMKSRNVLFQFGRAIFKLNPDWDFSSGGGTASGPVGPTSYDQAPTTSDWVKLPFDFSDKNSTSQDILAWNYDTSGNGGNPSRFRYLEMAAIVPDQFDMAYYSIEPDFYNNYYLRIKNKFLPKVTGFNQGVRPDIGYHKGFNDNIGWGVKDQINFLKGSTGQELSLEIDAKLTYIGKDWKHVLTGWADNGLLDYSLSKEKFGNCKYEPKMSGAIPSPPTSGNCVVGGSTGYSVKMISADYLKDPSLKLGGKNTSGQILNLPPPEFLK